MVQRYVLSTQEFHTGEQGYVWETEWEGMSFRQMRRKWKAYRKRGAKAIRLTIRFPQSDLTITRWYA